MSEKKDPQEETVEEEIAPNEEPAEVPETAIKPDARTVPTREDLTMAALAHASILVTFLIGVGSGGLGAVLGVLIPLGIWYGYRDKSTYTAEQALHATVYQVASVLAVLAFALVGAILVIVGWTVSGALAAVLIGLCLMPFALLVTLLLVAGIIVLPIVLLIYGLYAAYETYQGRDFRYKWISDWVDQQNWT
ncbi:MAG: hypothetical protein B6I34_07750 [Anaerolineaceae bacterium 4572_32.1]|nr:MAG: hypothetical protein B6I34_07750 [Anaerolineaceae bacterium 4572_32.1]